MADHPAAHTSNNTVAGAAQNADHSQPAAVAVRPAPSGKIGLSEIDARDYSAAVPGAAQHRDFGLSRGN